MQYWAIVAYSLEANRYRESWGMLTWRLEPLGWESLLVVLVWESVDEVQLRFVDVEQPRLVGISPA